MGLLPGTWNCGLRMRRAYRERFPRHRLQRKPLVSDTDMHHGTCITHVPWCMSGSLTNGGGEYVPGIPGACATRNFTYLARGPRESQLGYFVQMQSLSNDDIYCFIIFWKLINVPVSAHVTPDVMCNGVSSAYSKCCRCTVFCGFFSRGYL